MQPKCQDFPVTVHFDVKRFENRRKLGIIVASTHFLVALCFVSSLIITFCIEQQLCYNIFISFCSLIVYLMFIFIYLSVFHPFERSDKSSQVFHVLYLICKCYSVYLKLISLFNGLQIARHVKDKCSSPSPIMDFLFE